MILRWNYFAKLQQRWICQQLLWKQDQQPEWVQHKEEMINKFFQMHLELAPFPYSDDEAIMMHLLYTCDGYFLKYASRRLRDKFSVVSAAVSQNGRALRFASLRLKKNREIVKKAVNHCSRAIEFAFHDLKLEFEHEKFNKKLIQAGLDGYQQVFRELWPIRDERKTDPCFDSNNNERNTSTNNERTNNNKDTSIVLKIN
ncbi:hypothetical protein C9374_012227 [Naegleria lovaniensis]|uniref:DUF4116 domain-containing protein n=1 Tax=Naegleria lovaniensis TaxID=51637 RepID=A0AA88GBD5_NAELO|nr:uncharacterized protein C9374_012227 [Naegleria lovaniensis]KAG2373361.1 hypothetical protein C9374_012227 [Naegleria lovaniensis]